VSHYLYLWNRTYISRYTGMTPFEAYYKQEPSLRSVSMFGCDVYVWLHKQTREHGPFASRGEPGVYLGHDRVQNCAIVWLLKTQKEVRTRSVDYRENQFYYAQAMKSGSSAIQRVISDSEPGGSLDWIVSDSEDQSGVDMSTVSIPDRTDVPTLIEDDNSESNDDSEESFLVEKIVKHRKSQCNSTDGYDYYVKWVDYKRPTWEPAESLSGGANEILQEYRDAKELSAGAPEIPAAADHDSKSTVASGSQ
jgi:hypothetical protein